MNLSASKSITIHNPDTARRFYTLYGSDIHIWSMKRMLTFSKCSNLELPSFVFHFLTLHFLLIFVRFAIRLRLHIWILTPRSDRLEFRNFCTAHLRAGYARYVLSSTVPLN